MSTEELPADLDRLKIAPTLPHINLVHTNIPLVLNPFYNANNNSSADQPHGDSIHSAKFRMMQRRRCRFRRRSESFLDDCKQGDTLPAADSYDLTNPLRCSPGVQKLPLKKSNVTTAKKNLLREPILRSLNECAHMRCISGNRRLFSLNFEDDKADSALTKSRTTASSSKTSGISSFRDLISECNALLEPDGSDKGRLSSAWHSTKSFTTLQNEAAIGATSSGPFERQEQSRGSGSPRSNAAVRTASTALVRSSTTCSQQASNTASAASSSNCDEVNIDELASYFDTMVHIPKKMSSMAEMMYI